MRNILGIIAAVYVFLIIPCGVAYLVITKQLDLTFASDALKYIGDLTNSPAGGFVWGMEGNHDAGY